MGWESFHSIWDEPPDDRLIDAEEEKDKKKARSKKKLSWWEEFNDSARDEKESARSYSYDDAFDDSSPSWYRQSSFGYSRYSDYSPSRLFRSSFSSSYSGYSSSYSGDNAAKNKAIRALRTLTRNANTIANAASKIQYGVQFSSGADSNGVTAELTTGKKQDIYVSPDDIVAAKDTDEEDAAVDALTGFVLLRVQLTQSVDAETIRSVNACGISGMPIKLATVVREMSAGAPLPASTAAAGLVDDYLAGMLAKSMLTRLCRRSVVSDWSGFAPYFVRHAKKFLSAKEKIEGLGLSVEGAASKIAYNMVAAEDEITLPPEIVKIVDEHLGEKLEVAAILPACQKLVAKIREWLDSQAEKITGNIEDALTKAIDKVVDRSNKSSESARTEEQQTREGLDKLADMLDELRVDELENVEQRAKDEEKITESRELFNELTELSYKEKFVKELKDKLHDIKNNVINSSCRDEKLLHDSLGYHVNTLKQHMMHFNAQALQLQAKVPDADKVAPPNYDKILKENAAAEAKVAAEKVTEALEKFAGQFLEILKQEIADMRKTIRDMANAAAELIPEKQEHVKELLDKNTAVADNLVKLQEEFGTVSSAVALSQHILIMLNKTSATLKLAKKDLEMISKSSARSATGLKTEAKMAAAAIERLVNADVAADTLNAVRRSGGGTPAQKFINDAFDQYEKIAEGSASAEDIKDWHEPAINDFMAEDSLTAAQFIAMALRELNKELFEALTQAIRNKDTGGLPRNLDKLTPEAMSKLQKAADSLGLTPQELLNMLTAANKAIGKAFNCSEATRLGDIVNQVFDKKAKELSPIDEQLFGETVKKKTTLLDDAAINTVNEEATNAVEEEYVAYLTHSEAKPKLRVLPGRHATDPYIKRIAAEVVKRNRGAIDKIRNALQFQNNKRVGEVYGTLSGDLDEGSLHKLRYDSEHIWSQKTITKLPDVAVGLLVDQSGSMSGSKIDQAREMCILLAEAVKRIKGVHLHIYGHTANMNGSEDLVLYEHFSSTNSAENANLSNLGAIAAYSNNYDGYAIKETAKLLNQDPAKRKYLFIIADGLPHGTGYSGEDAQKHVTSVCSFVRSRLKIPTYAFAVGVSNSQRKDFEEQYGANNVIFLSRVSACLPQIVRFLRNALQKEKTLVSATAD